MGAARTTSAIVAIVAAVFSMAGSAFAHGNEVHAAAVQPAAPAAIPAVNEPVTGGGAVGGTPANGAQPAAPTNTLPPVVAGSVGNTGAAVVKPAAVKVVEPVKVVQPVAGSGTSGAADSSGSSTSTTTTTPNLNLETISEPVTAPAPKTASGGGGGVMDASASAVPASAPVVTGSGDLPFTGIEETILLIALAGMLVPIGVLLYCGARRGDRTMYLRQLSAPRFQWAPAPGVRPDASQWPDVRG